MRLALHWSWAFSIEPYSPGCCAEKIGPSSLSSRAPANLKAHTLFPFYETFTVITHERTTTPLPYDETFSVGGRCDAGTRMNTFLLHLANGQHLSVSARKPPSENKASANSPDMAVHTNFPKMTGEIRRSRSTSPLVSPQTGWHNASEEESLKWERPVVFLNGCFIIGN